MTHGVQVPLGYPLTVTKPRQTPTQPMADDDDDFDAGAITVDIEHW